MYKRLKEWKNVEPVIYMNVVDQLYQVYLGRMPSTKIINQRTYTRDKFILSSKPNVLNVAR